MKINKIDIIETLKDGGKLLGTLALKIYGESLDQVGEQAFSEAIELGIENTVASLYDAKVSDNEIIRVVCERTQGDEHKGTVLLCDDEGG